MRHYESSVKGMMLMKRHWN